MAHDPFLTLRVCSCRDLVHLRHQARQIAQLLSFRPHEAIEFAASAFVLAHQAKARLRRADVCFALADRQLRVFARPAPRGLRAPDDLLTLVKSLPDGDQRVAAEDLPWMLRQLQLLTPIHLEDELSRQNQEVIFLLSLLADNRGISGAGANPWAA